MGGQQQQRDWTTAARDMGEGGELRAWTAPQSQGRGGRGVRYIIIIILLGPLLTQ
jgi:hypothetical protein